MKKKNQITENVEYIYNNIIYWILNICMFIPFF